MGIDRSDLWMAILGLGIGTYLMRFSFLGALGGRMLPGWLTRPLRYAAVGVIPGLVVPGVIGPGSTGSGPDAVRIVAALAALGCGVMFRSMLAGILGGVVALYAAPVVLGL